VTVKDIVEAIETALMEAQAAGKTLTAAEIIANFEGVMGLTRYDIGATLRGMKMGGRLIEIKNKLYLQRSLLADGD
jgi:hypothetical protein